VLPIRELVRYAAAEPGVTIMAAAVLPARRAARLDVLGALAYE
jgi:ABC-type lipoprotein release transport system permease subunit